MKREIKITLLALGIVLSLPAMAGSVTGAVKTSASLSAFCTIQTSNINFGQIILPAAQNGQVSSTTMNVLCTKGSSYSIVLAYGGKYGTTSNTDYYTQTNDTGKFTHYDGNGVVLGSSATVPSPYSESSSIAGISYYYNLTLPQVKYAYGILNGATSGDTISYKITAPGNDSKVWNNGSYAYPGVGTGVTQSIPVKATLQTGVQGPAYPTPDNYSDTVTTTINF